MKHIRVKVKRKEDARDLPLPKYTTTGSSGMDLYADVNADIELNPGDIRLISCGIYLSIPFGFEAEIRPRSGLALKHGITLLNTPGTIDSDYRGELKVLLINYGESSFSIKVGDRIAQAIINKVEIAQFEDVNTISVTERDSGGFGSTGK